MPCGAPGMILSVLFFESFADFFAESSIGTIDNIGYTRALFDRSRQRDRPRVP